jgi:hypothetical protein
MGDYNKILESRTKKNFSPGIT